MTRALLRVATAALLLVPLRAASAQANLFPQGSVMGGVEARQYKFGDNFGVNHVRQVAFPIAAMVPIGQRFSVDVGTWYAVTTVARPGASDESFSNLTDTQLRAAYVFGSDALVATVMVNLPTGAETTTLQKFNIASSASSNFLLFPVNSYGAGTSVTPGLSAATTAGDWNLGLAASARWSAEYHPFSDTANGASAVKYKPGIETRVRAGVDRLVGQGRFSLGFTFSTFSNDQLNGGSFGNGVYDPGNRFLVDANLATPVGGGTVNFYAWNYYRSTSSSSGTATSNAGGHEDVFTAGLSGAFPLGARAAVEPVVEARFWSPVSGSGTLVGTGASLRYQASEHISLVPGVRVDVGTIKTPTTGSNSIFGWDLSALIRYGF
ncbi:MAG TPA: hypothetical protein VNH46_10970 [Gemmatimonadales bacterium]|nr:hypothetical protein [Gemmatimonadales bacterium]